MPHTDRKQICWHVEEHTVAGATDPAVGFGKTDRQHLTIIVCMRVEACQPPVDPVLFSLVVKAVDLHTQQLHDDVRPRLDYKIAALMPEGDRMGTDLFALADHVVI